MSYRKFRIATQKTCKHYAGLYTHLSHTSYTHVTFLHMVLDKSALLHSYADPTFPRKMNITKVFQDGIELNWLPPTEPNGEVHYVIYYTPEGGTEQSIDTGSDLTHYNLTGLERNRVYTNIAVQAVHLVGRSERSAVSAG